MNTQAEIHQAIADYRRTLFGGWPWRENAPVHDRDAGRFAKHADGRVEKVSSCPASAGRDLRTTLGEQLAQHGSMAACLVFAITAH